VRELNIESSFPREFETALDGIFGTLHPKTIKQSSYGYSKFTYFLHFVLISLLKTIKTMKAITQVDQVLGQGIKGDKSKDLYKTIFNMGTLHFRLGDFLEYQRG
jgi:hypothetical protein